MILCRITLVMYAVVFALSIVSSILWELNVLTLSFTMLGLIGMILAWGKAKI